MTKNEKTILKKLEFLYKKKAAEKTLAGVKELLSKYKTTIQIKDLQFSEKDVFQKETTGPQAIKRK